MSDSKTVKGFGSVLRSGGLEEINCRLIRLVNRSGPFNVTYPTTQKKNIKLYPKRVPLLRVPPLTCQVTKVTLVYFHFVKTVFGLLNGF